MRALTQSQLAGVVCHSRLRFGDQNGTAFSHEVGIGRLEGRRESYTAVSTVRIEYGTYSRCLRSRQLVAIAIIGQMVPNLTVISRAQGKLIGERVFRDQCELVDVGRLHILRPYGVERIIDPERLAEGIGDCKWGSARGP